MVPRPVGKFSYVATCLLAHDVVEICLCLCLLYPLSMSSSAILITQPAFDILIVVLTWHEDCRHRARHQQKDGTP